MNFLNSKTISVLVLVWVCAIGMVHAQTEKKATQNTLSSDHEHFYYYKGVKQNLSINPKYIFVSGSNASEVQEANLSSLVKIKEANEVEVDNFYQTLDKTNLPIAYYPNRYWTFIELSESFSEKAYFNQIEALKSKSNLIVAPFFESNSYDKICLSNYFHVKLKKSADIDILMKQIDKYELELVGRDNYMPLWFTVSVKSNTLNAMQMANLFYETGLFHAAEPDLMTENDVQGDGQVLMPNDPLYSDQWHLNNTGQSGGTIGIDINAEDAWDITTGSSDIHVAVIDQGIEMDHPDLVNNIVGVGFDMPNDSSPSILHSTHGTPCAGIIGAEGDNNEGVSGVAPNTSLVSISDPLSFATRPLRGRGFNWAVENDIDVISCSWHAGDLPFEQLNDAIQNALENGRDGLGAVVVFATGNDFEGEISYPGNSDLDIIAVGAIDDDGDRANFSNFGVGLDVVAPGVGITTTRNGGNYELSFTGTSAACPVVSGIAALVLSINPNLTGIEVNDIIEQSAQKTNEGMPYDYEITAGRPNGTWNNEMGYGLVDAHAAVLLAQATLEVVCDDVFVSYPWLNNFVDQNNCTDVTIDVYEEGPYTFINVISNGVSTIYFNGQQWCVGPTCLDFYVSTDPVASWSCECGPNCPALTTTTFESGWENWNDGGAFCFIQNAASVAWSGSKSVHIRRYGKFYSDNIDLTGYSDVTLNFNLNARNMDNATDDLRIQWSQFGNTSTGWIQAADLDFGVDFENNTNTRFSIPIPGPFTTNTAFRFVSSTNNNQDIFNIDDVSITGCYDGFVIDYVTAQVNAPCYNANHVDLNADCLSQPEQLVCGCDGFTYYNICTAYWSGLDSYTLGACNAGMNDNSEVTFNIGNDDISKSKPLAEDIQPEKGIKVMYETGTSIVWFERDLSADGAVLNYQVFDLHGKLVTQSSTNQDRWSLDTFDLPKGMYVMYTELGAEKFIVN